MVKKHSETTVFRNDEISLEEVGQLNPRGILISPGPGKPQDSGISLSLVRKFRGMTPILGVCLGHQIMGDILGMEVAHAIRPMHGRTSMISHDQRGLFLGLPSPLRVMRYHSLVVLPQKIPPGMRITAQTSEGEIMGLSHQADKLEGVQFHPESILSEGGDRLIKNWIEMIWS